MTATPDHGQLDASLQGIHVPFQFKFPDEASRTGAPASRLTGGASKFAYQEDTSAIWLLAETEPTPTWASMATGIAASAIGGVSEGANLGDGGYGIFSEKSGASLLFKTLIAGTAITLASAASTVTIANDIDGVNLGTGIEVFRETTGGSLSFRTLVGAGTVSIASAASTVTITGAAGGGSEVVTEGVNVGTGFEVFREKSGASLVFKTLIAGNSVSLASGASDVTITATPAAGSEVVTEGVNVGTGFEVFREKSGASLVFKTLVAGTDMTLASAASTITITAPSSASVGHFSATIGASNTWNNELIPLWQAPRDGSATIVEMLSTTLGTNTPTLSFNLQHRDWDAMQTAGEDIFGASQTATSAGEQVVAFDRATIDPRAHIMFTTGSAAEGGSVNYLQMTVYYII